MKKMNKMYEAPVAEVIAIEAVGVMMTSAAGNGTASDPIVTPGTPGSGPSIPLS